MPDVFLFARDAGRGVHDASLRTTSKTRDVYLRVRPADLGRGVHDVELYPASIPQTVSVGGPAFPTQYSGLRARTASITVDLCLVASGDAPSGMGGALKVRKGGSDYAVYLVETTDPNASPFRIRTSTGTKSIRLKT